MYPSFVRSMIACRHTLPILIERETCACATDVDHTYSTRKRRGRDSNACMCQPRMHACTQCSSTTIWHCCIPPSSIDRRRTRERWRAYLYIINAVNSLGLARSISKLHTYRTLQKERRWGRIVLPHVRASSRHTQGHRGAGPAGRRIIAARETDQMCANKKRRSNSTSHNPTCSLQRRVWMLGLVS